MIKNLFKFDAMTTPCEVVIYSKDKEQATQIAKEILLRTKELEKKYNYFNDESTLSLINNRKQDTLDNETKELLQKAKIFYKLTNKTFDITIATIKPLYSKNNLHIFHQEKEKLLEFVGSEHFTIKKNKIFFDNQFTKIDLGGIVKEYAVDEAVQILKKRKITSGLINFGGDIYALGKKPNGEKFNIGIKDPLNKTQNVTTVELENMALTTSANYERNYQIEDQNFSHIINPHNYTSEIISATVISPSALLSGIYSTSLICNDAISSKYQTIKINKNKEILYENFDSRR